MFFSYFLKGLVMKRIVLFMSFALIFSGCLSFKTEIRQNRSTLVVKETTNLYLLENDTPTNQVIGEAKTGERLQSYQYITGASFIYCVDYAGKKAWVREFSVYSEGEYQLFMQRTEFEVDSAKNNESWARATIAISKYSTMKLQLSNDFLLETYNPLTYTDKAFTITRMPKGTKFLYDVKVRTKSGNYVSECTQLSKLVAFYIANGERINEFPYTQCRD
jgi:hypothetical protein